jgi:hypothetical protein
MDAIMILIDIDAELGRARALIDRLRKASIRPNERRSVPEESAFSLWLEDSRDRIDDAAFGDAAAGAAVERARELFAKRFEPANFCVDLGQMIAGHRVDLRAGPLRHILQR